jgi:glycosyltransferase involved in cell wall biosynthesis
VAIMTDLIPSRATICVVNYRTLEFTRLCLRSIRKFTPQPYEVIVVDNDSRDASVDYLRSLSWIRLIERRNARDASGGDAHGAALDAALAECRTEFFVSLHSDSFLRRENWLGDLLAHFGPRTACVGSGKLELRPLWQQRLHDAFDFRMHLRRLFRTPDPAGKYRYYNRTICCVYRTEVLRRENLSFLMDRDKGLTAGKKLYFELVDRGYPTVELSPAVMARYVVHLTHATEPVVVKDDIKRNKTVHKIQWRIDRVMNEPWVRDILADDSLDR